MKILAITAAALVLATAAPAQVPDRDPGRAAGQIGEPFGIRSQNAFSGTESCLVFAKPGMPGMNGPERKFVPIGLPSKEKERAGKIEPVPGGDGGPYGLLLR